MEWNQNLSIGVPTLDDQHRQLVAAFNELQGAMRSGQGSAQLLSTLRFLGEYAVKHFSTEESLMRVHRYPGLEAHRAEHDAFRADFARIMKEAEAARHRVAMTMDVSNRILEWLLAHIGRVDRRMGEYLVERGVR